MKSSKILTYHTPVLLDEVVEGMEIKQDGVYVDATFGSGGHSRSMLNKLGVKGRLYVIDQDGDAKQNIITDDPRFSFIHGNFRYIRRYLRYEGISRVDGILADLGVSSYQFDTVGRGFSIRFEDDLDMRMNKKIKLTAAIILNTYSMDRLVGIFSFYGNVRNSKSLARKIIERRKSIPFKSVTDFMEFIDRTKIGTLQKYASTVFQALRIEVNDEYQALKDFLAGVGQVLGENGVLAVISYHSLEDKLVKNFIRSGNVDGIVNEDEKGRVVKVFDPINKKVIIPSAEEVERNSRAKSAKLRLARKL